MAGWVLLHPCLVACSGQSSYTAASSLCTPETGPAKLALPGTTRWVPPAGTRPYPPVCPANRSPGGGKPRLVTSQPPLLIAGDSHLGSPGAAVCWLACSTWRNMQSLDNPLKPCVYSQPLAPTSSNPRRTSRLFPPYVSCSTTTTTDTLVYLGSIHYPIYYSSTHATHPPQAIICIPRFPTWAGPRTHAVSSKQSS